MAGKSNSVAIKAQSSLNTTNSKKKSTSATPNYLGDGVSKAIAPSGADLSNYYLNPASGAMTGYDPRFYGYRSNAFNIPTGFGFNAPMRYGDDYWNLGAALGALWGANYNKRGAEKSAAEAERLMQEYKQAFGQGEKPKEDQPSDEITQRYKAATEGLPQLSMDGTTKQPNDVQPTAENLGKGLQYFNQDGTLQMPQRDYRGEARDFIVGKYGLDTNTPHDNPEGDKKDGDKIGQAVASDLSKIDVTKMPQGGYDGEALRNSIIAKLRAQGRNDWQIAQAMQTIAPQIAQGQKDYNDSAFDTLYQQFGQLIKNNDADSLDKASMLYSNMVKLKPEYSKALGLQYDRAYGKYSEKQKFEDTVAKYKEMYPNYSEDEIRKYVLDGFKFDQMERTDHGLVNPYASVGSPGRAGKDATKKATKTTNPYLTADNFSEDGRWLGYTGDQMQKALEQLVKLGYKANSDPSAIPDPWMKKTVVRLMSIVQNQAPQGISPYTGYRISANNYQDVYSGFQQRFEGYLAKGMSYADAISKTEQDMSNIDFTPNIAADFRDEYGVNGNENPSPTTTKVNSSPTDDGQTNFDKINKPLSAYMPRTPNDSPWNNYLDNSIMEFQLTQEWQNDPDEFKANHGGRTLDEELKALKSDE